jgi:acyl-coenzyme A thioesterase PaaI-like protein
VTSSVDARCLESFERQGMMRLIGAKLVEAEAGRAVIEVPYRKDLTQQHGYAST